MVDKMMFENLILYDYLILVDYGVIFMVELYIEGMILIIIVLVVFVGNVLVYFIVIWNKKLWIIINFFILGLVVVDIFVFIVNMFVIVVVLYVGKWFLDYMFCLVFGFINMLILCFSVFFLCNISINWYVMICCFF